MNNLKTKNGHSFKLNNNISWHEKEFNNLTQGWKLRNLLIYLKMNNMPEVVRFLGLSRK